MARIQIGNDVTEAFKKLPEYKEWADDFNAQFREHFMAESLIMPLIEPRLKFSDRLRKVNKAMRPINHNP